MQKKASKPKSSIAEISKVLIISVNNKQGRRIFNINWLTASDDALFIIYVKYTPQRTEMTPASTIVMTTTVPSIETRAELLTTDIMTLIQSKSIKI